MKQIIDRYQHSPIFWAFTLFLLFISYCLAGTLDRQNAESRGETTHTYSQQ
jgi:hypothetical protein